MLRRIVEGEYEPRNMPSIGGLTQSDLLYFAEEAEVLGNLSWANFFIQVRPSTTTSKSRAHYLTVSFFFYLDGFLFKQS